MLHNPLIQEKSKNPKTNDQAAAEMQLVLDHNTSNYSHWS